MGKLVVFMNVSLDGVIQSPGRPDEDRSGGFEQGGWAVPYGAMQSREAGENLGGWSGLLLGRRTYDDFYDFWPKQANNPFTDALNNMPKYVASTTLQDPLGWQNTTLLKDDLPGAVNAIKAQTDNNLVIMGSANLVQSLMKSNLVDRYVLMVHPLVLGSGKRLFENGGVPANLQLVSASPTDKGVVVATYEPASRAQA